MKDINSTIQELHESGIEPSLLLLGLKQRKELNDLEWYGIPESFRLDKPKIETYVILGFTLKIIYIPAEDFCQAYGNSTKS